MPVEPDERRMDREAYVCTRESERRGRRGWHGRTKNRTPRCLERGPREIVGFFVFHFHCAHVDFFPLFLSLFPRRIVVDFTKLVFEFDKRSG